LSGLETDEKISSLVFMLRFLALGVGVFVMLVAASFVAD
jgi:hypothetical protein